MLKQHASLEADVVFRPWVQHDHPAEITTTSITRHRLNTDLQPVYAEPERATQTETVMHQTKLRVSEVDDGFNRLTVLEEQDVIFSERIIVWGPPPEKGGEWA